MHGNRVIFLAAGLLLLSLLAWGQTAGSTARVWEAKITIPTYELGPPDPDPDLLGSGGTNQVYPYSRLDNLTDKRVQKSYKAVFLENEFLRVTVLPELGGRIYEIYDRNLKQDVLYTNHVVKYGLVGLRGAWISGGVEWNFPDGHSVTTVSPVDYVMHRENDGSAAVVVGDTERIQRMQWVVAIRLRPGRKAVECGVTLYNRRELPGRYWYWANAAARATDDLRFVYPMREAYPHTFWPVFSFPEYKGVDLGTYREVPNALSLFARDSRRDFLGVYYEKADWGVVHVADHRELPGKKTWTWGNDASGRTWIEKLTDNDGQYVEIQAGRFETQMEHELIPPHQVERFVEYWYPVEHLGGPFDEANALAALRLAARSRSARVWINVTTRIDGARLTFEQEGREFHTETVSLFPGEAYSVGVNLPRMAEDSPVTVRLFSPDGREVISYRTDMPLDGDPDFKPAARPVSVAGTPATAEVAYLEGVAFEKRGENRKARTSYQEALQHDSGYSPAHIALGLSCLRSGLYEPAREHLSAALRRDPDSIDAHYYLGLVMKAEGRMQAAADELTWVARSGRRESTARYLLGTLALSSGNPVEAIKQLSRAVELEPRDTKARVTLALAARLAGTLDYAGAQIDIAVRDMPLDYFALSELLEIAKLSGMNDLAAQSEHELWRLLGREPDSVLELAFDYAFLGRIVDCRSLLRVAIERASALHAPVYPMFHYTLGYFLDKEGDQKAALDQYAAGASGNPVYVFPHRVEEIEVLRAAVKANPSDGRAYYYLGNALAFKEREDEALDAWRKAARMDKENPTAQRNLALALWRIGDKQEDAAGAYQSALALSRSDPRLYVELDNLLRDLDGETERRIRLLEGAPSEVRDRSSVIQALASAYLDAGRDADAQRLLERSTITAGEGESTALSLYHRACLGMARSFQEAGNHTQAAAEFMRATEYPRNLGVGRSSTESHAREYVAVAKELEASGQAEAGASLWRRAAAEPLGTPSLPYEPWSEQYYYKAEALRHIGRVKEAEALLNRLAALAEEGPGAEAEPDPPEGALRYRLAGLALQALGRLEEARAAFARAGAEEKRGHNTYLPRK